MGEISELARKVDNLIYDEYQDKLNDFFYEIREKVSDELVDDDEKCREYSDSAYFIFNMRSDKDKEWCKKLRNYLDSERIEYSIDTDYDNNNSEITTYIKVGFDQFYEKVRDNIIDIVIYNINFFLKDIKHNVDKRIINYKKYKIYIGTYNVAFRFNLEEDKELYDKLKNYLNQKNIKYIEDIDYEGPFKLNVIEIVPNKFI
jgi:hypothetical protein